MGPQLSVEKDIERCERFRTLKVKQIEYAFQGPMSMIERANES